MSTRPIQPVCGAPANPRPLIAANPFLATAGRVSLALLAGIFLTTSLAAQTPAPAPKTGGTGSVLGDADAGASSGFDVASYDDAEGLWAAISALLNADLDASCRSDEIDEDIDNARVALRKLYAFFNSLTDSGFAPQNKVAKAVWERRGKERQKVGEQIDDLTVLIDELQAKDKCTPPTKTGPADPPPLTDGPTPNPGPNPPVGGGETPPPSGGKPDDANPPVCASDIMIAAAQAEVEAQEKLVKEKRERLAELEKQENQLINDLNQLSKSGKHPLVIKDEEAKNAAERDKLHPQINDLRQELETIDEPELEELKKKLRSLRRCGDPETPEKPTDGDGSMVVPGDGARGQYKISYATDSGTWCTYGDGVQLTASIVPSDANGEPVAYNPTPFGAPAGDGRFPPRTATPADPKTPPVSRPQPRVPPRAETPRANEPKTPAPRQAPPPRTVSAPPIVPKNLDAPPKEPSSPIPPTVFVKAKQEVIEQGQTGRPIEGQVVKLFPREKPGLPAVPKTDTATKSDMPRSEASKDGAATTDVGFDKDPVECTTDAQGACKLELAADEQKFYGLPETTAPKTAEPDKKPTTAAPRYRLDLDVPLSRGTVVETTGRKPDLAKPVPKTTNVSANAFKIGDRTFARLSFKTPYQSSTKLPDTYTPLYGDKAEDDFCRDKQPGPPADMKPAMSKPAADLPMTRLRLGVGGTMRRP